MVGTKNFKNGHCPTHGMRAKMQGQFFRDRLEKFKDANYTKSNTIYT